MPLLARPSQLRRSRHHRRAADQPAEPPPAQEGTPGEGDGQASHTTDGVPVGSGTRFTFLAAASRYALDFVPDGATVDWDDVDVDAEPDEAGPPDDDERPGHRFDDVPTVLVDDLLVAIDEFVPEPARRRHARPRRPRLDDGQRRAAWQAAIVALVVTVGVAAFVLRPHSSGSGHIVALDDSVLQGNPTSTTTRPRPTTTAATTQPLVTAPARAAVAPRPAPTTTTTTTAFVEEPVTTVPEPPATTPDTTAAPVTTVPATTPTTARPGPTWPTTTRPSPTTTTTTGPSTTTTTAATTTTVPASSTTTTP